MSEDDGHPVQFYLLTRDADLASRLAEDMADAQLGNELSHGRAPSDVISLLDHAETRAPGLVLVDMRAPNGDALAFLNEVQDRDDARTPIVVAIADRDEETAPLSAHRNIVAGRISSDLPGPDLVRLIDSSFPANWTIESE